MKLIWFKTFRFANKSSKDARFRRSHHCKMLQSLREIFHPLAGAKSQNLKRSEVQPLDNFNMRYNKRIVFAYGPVNIQNTNLQPGCYGSNYSFIPLLFSLAIWTYYEIMIELSICLLDKKRIYDTSNNNNKKGLKKATSIIKGKSVRYNGRESLIHLPFQQNFWAEP